MLKEKLRRRRMKMRGPYPPWLTILVVIILILVILYLLEGLL